MVRQYTGSWRRTLTLGAICFVGLAASAARGQGIVIEDRRAETQAEAPCVDSSNRYVNCGNGTVTDTVTDLVWLHTANCLDLPGTSVSGLVDWPTANHLVAGLEDGFCNLTDGSQPGDWRLPTADEWVDTVFRAVVLGCTGEDDPSLTNTAGTDCFSDPAAAIVAFAPWEPFVSMPGTPRFWTSTLDDVAPSQARSTNLTTGQVESQTKTSLRFVWPVRERH